MDYWIQFNTLQQIKKNTITIQNFELSMIIAMI